MKINQKEIESVSVLEPLKRYQYLLKRLEPLKRYQYLLKRVADGEIIYTLESQLGDWASSTVRDYSLFPIWSASEYALNCTIDAWSNFNVVETNLNDFIEITLPEIEEEGMLLNVFPVGNKTGFVVKSSEFIRDITEELKNYE